MANVIEVSGGGTHYATGVVADGVTEINVTGLGFRPRAVMYRCNTFNWPNTQFQAAIFDGDGDYGVGFTYARTSSGNQYTTYNDFLTVSDDGFTYASLDGTTYRAGVWVAIG